MHHHPVALAAFAHPDDVEIMAAGTLLRLRERGVELHVFNLCNGCYGSVRHGKDDTARIRLAEAQASARRAGATLHAPVSDDMSLCVDLPTLRKVVAVVRRVRPSLVLTHSPEDYMDDHVNACRLTVSGVFSRGMPGFESDPPLPHWPGHTAVYHAMPHGLTTPLRKRVRAGQYVDITPVLGPKRAMLAEHASQKEWLDVSQGMDSYLDEMERMCRTVGALSGHFDYAEGWRRRSHLGFGPPDYDPLQALLGDACWTDPAYETSLQEP